MDRNIRRGDMYYADLPPGVGSEQSGYRPVLVIQNNRGNKHSNTVIVAIMTSRTKGKAALPTHCLIPCQQGLVCDSLVLLEQIRTLDKARLGAYAGSLDAQTMLRVDDALSVSLGLELHCCIDHRPCRIGCSVE